MGGYGSGNYSGRPSTGQVNVVDIRLIRKHGWLYDGREGVLAWSSRNTGQSRGQVGYRIEGDTFTLVYRWSGGGEHEDVTLSVRLTSIPCRYGGHRYYFECPRCGRRCEVLHSISKWFVCRECSGYIYPTQTGCELDRLITNKHNLGYRIFEDYGNGWGSQRKKGMHRKTFEKLQAEWYRLDEQIESRISERFGWEV